MPRVTTETLVYIYGIYMENLFHIYGIYMEYMELIFPRGTIIYRDNSPVVCSLSVYAVATKKKGHSVNADPAGGARN